LREKVKLARNLLIYSEYSIENIGLYLGFSSQSHFGRVFKKYTGVTPNIYRKRNAKKDFMID
jgi:AraC-like DNA-binding protein